MPNNFWKQFGDTYDKVNSTLGGIPDFVKGVGEKIGKPVMAGISNFDQTMMQSLPGQIGSAIGGAIVPQQSASLTSDVNQAASQGQQDYPVPALIGKGAALAGQMVNGPTIPAAAAGTAASKLIPTLGRNALTAAGQTVPGAIAEGVQTGDWGHAAVQGLKDTAIGSLIGTGGEKILGAIPALVNAAKKTLMGQAISGGLEIDPRSFRKIVTYGPIGKFAGNIINRAEDLKQQLVNLMVDNPSLKSEAGRQKFVDILDQKWGKVDDAYNSFTPAIGQGKVSSFRDEIIQHPLVQEALNNDPNLMGKLDEIVGKADKRKDLAATRHLLQKDYIDPSFAPGSTTSTEDVANLAHGVRDVIDEHFVPPELKETYARDKVIKEALSREDLKLPKATIPGSPTYARLAANAALGGLGGEAAGVLGGQDPEQALNTAAIMAGSGIIGGVGQRIGSHLINKGISSGEGRLAQLLGKIPQGSLEGMEGAAPRIAQAAARGPQIADTQNAITDHQAEPAISQTPPSAAVPTAQSPEMEGTNWQEGPGQAPPIQPPERKTAPEHQAAVQQASYKEGLLDPQQVSDAKEAALTPFQERVKERLYQRWDSWANPYKMDWQDFYKDALDKSEGFDPKNEYTAKFIGGADYKNYLRSYNVALNLQSLGKDLGSVIGNYGPNLFDPAMREKRDRLVNTVYTAMTGETKNPDKDTRAKILTRLYNIARGGGDKQSKLKEMLQNEYNVKFDLVNKYGVQQ